MSRTSHLELVRNLRERLQQIESCHRPAGEQAVCTGTALDRLLPRKGLEWGTLIELLHDEGSGTVTLELTITARLLQQGGALVVMDGKHEFYPPAAASLGIPLERTVVVRPHGERDALWAWEQSLRSSAATVTLGEAEELNE